MNSKTYYSLFIVSIFLPLLLMAAVAFRVSTLTSAPLLMVSLAIVGIWILAIIDAAKTKKINPLWILGLAFFATIIMPIYFYKKYKNSLMAAA
jgi:hypothetical protein